MSLGERFSNFLFCTNFCWTFSICQHQNRPHRRAFHSKWVLPTPSNLTFASTLDFFFFEFPFFRLEFATPLYLNVDKRITLCLMNVTLGFRFQELSCTDKLKALEFLQSGFSHLINSSNIEQEEQVRDHLISPWSVIGFLVPSMLQHYSCKIAFSLL